MKHLETFEAACELLGYDANEVLPVVNKMPEALAKATTAATKLFIISEASWKAENKVINWNDESQYKYYPWWDMETYGDAVGSAPGFSYGDYCYGYSFTTVGSRLVFPSRDVVKYVAKQHYQLYRDMMVIE